MVTGERILSLRHPHPICSLQISPNEQFLLTITTGKESPARLWNLVDGKLVAEYPSVLLGKDTKGNSLRYCFPSRSVIYRKPKTSYGFTSIAFSKTGEAFVAGCDNGDVVLWNTFAAHKRFHILGSDYDLNAISSVDLFLEENRMLTTSIDGMVQLWDLETKRILERYSSLPKKHDEKIYPQRGSLVLATNSETFVYYRPADNTFHLHSIKTGELIKTWASPAESTTEGSQYYRSAEFLPDRNLFLYQGGQYAEIFDVNTQESLWSHVFKSGVNRFYSHPTIRHIRYLPKVNAVMAVENENDENTGHSTWTVISVLPRNKNSNTATQSSLSSE